MGVRRKVKELKWQKNIFSAFPFSSLLSFPSCLPSCSFFGQNLCKICIYFFLLCCLLGGNQTRVLYLYALGFYTFFFAICCWLTVPLLLAVLILIENYLSNITLQCCCWEVRLKWNNPCDCVGGNKWWKLEKNWSFLLFDWQYFYWFGFQCLCRCLCVCIGSWPQHWLIYNWMSSQLDSSNDKRNGTKGSVSSFCQATRRGRVHAETSTGHEKYNLVDKRLRFLLRQFPGPGHHCVSQKSDWLLVTHKKL